MANDRIAIVDLRPTQLTLGLDEVTQRAAKIAKMAPKEREAYVERKAIPHVVGPNGRIYIVDHHHLARALWSLDIREAALGEKMKDWSDLDEKRFWPKMEDAGYCWPIDADGNRRPFAAIPHHISELTDNPWRTLARQVRGTAFDDLDTPFQEFIWGDYFRSFMSRRLIDTDLALASELAVKISRLSEAQDLPGFMG